MNKLKLDIVVGTRPEIIRLSRVISVADKVFDLRVIHTGQNYDPKLSQIFFEQLELREPDVYLQCARGSAAETISSVIHETHKIFSSDKPDALLVLGDTNSCMSALSAKRLRIPIFHMEAGNRCFDDRVPEEINRKIIDQLADINMPYSNISRDFLLREGFKPDQIVKTGSPLYEVVDYYNESILASDILVQLGLQKGEFFLVSSHREENIDDPNKLRKLLGSLNAIAQQYQMPIILSCHPRLKNNLSKFNYSLNDKIIVCEPFGFFDYCKLQTAARVVLSDSGSINEEASILGFNALNIRENHERHEAMEEAATIMVGFNVERIIQAIDLLVTTEGISSNSMVIPNEYSSKNVSLKVIRIIMSYVDFINRRTWSKNSNHAS